MVAEFRLSASLFAHEQDVRAVSFLSNDLIVSAARDKTVRSWRRTAPNEFVLEHVYHGHDHFVNSLASIPPSERFPNGLVVSGGSDKLINVFDPASNSTLYTLIGHTENVCALTVSPSGHIISGSWDKKVIVWKEFQQAYLLKGHSAAVWAVLALEDDLIVTAAADKTIRIWKDGKQLRVIQGHTDAVRGLARLAGVGFISCSNDGVLKVWTIDGECVQELYGHTSFVYSVTVLSTGELVSCGEDRTVRVWKDGQCVQTIQQPCISVWAVTALPNDDIVVGGSDCIVRIFTRSPERLADPEAQKHFDDTIANQAIPSNQIGNINKEKLAGPEALRNPGTKEGQVIMINTGTTVEAHQWSTQRQSWQKIGEVVGGVGSGTKKLFEGKEYDYVFDIDIGAGPEGMLKLPYNVTENPYEAAQKFIWRHQLPQIYLDQIADFITKNAQGVELGQTTGQYHDPFTGGSRYVPGRSTAPTAQSGQFMDPFTGASSYRPQGSSMPAVPRSVPPALAQKVLPMTEYLSLKQANLDAIFAKLKSLNTGIKEEDKLTEEQLSALSNAVTYLKNPEKAELKKNENGLLVLINICRTWPPAQRFPALDLLRLFTLVAPEAVAGILAQQRKEEGPVSFLQQAGGLLNPSSDKVAETNAMLAFRGLVNMFDKPEGRSIVWEKRQVLAQVLQFDVVGNFKGKGVRLAICTLALNFATLLTTRVEGHDEDNAIGLTGSLIEIIKEEKDEENLYRALVALGTLMNRSDACKEAACIMDAKVQLHRIKSEYGDRERMRRVIDEMNAMF